MSDINEQINRALKRIEDEAKCVADDCEDSINETKSTIEDQLFVISGAITRMQGYVNEIEDSLEKLPE